MGGEAAVERHPDGARVERRTWTPDAALRIVGCVEFEPTDSALTPSHADVLRDLAVRRLERCIRPGDWMCMIGGNRVVVVFGNGGHRVAPSVLGRRLARAMGDHLSVGSDGVDVRVAVGLSAGPVDLEIDELTRSALQAARIARRHIDDSSTERHAVLTVTHLPKGRRPEGDESADANGPLRPHRITRRVVDSLSPRMEATELGRIAAGDTGSLRQIVGTVPRVLLIDPGAVNGTGPRLAVEAVAATVRRLGARTTVAPSADPDRVLLDLYVSEPHVAVVILQSDACRIHPSALASRTWDDLSVLVRSLRATGMPVIAVAVGASAAAVAACMEQGAIGLLQAEELPQELANVISQVHASGGNGSGPGMLPGPDAVARKFPAPFAALVALTPSERRVLFHMMEGLSATEIAEVLVVSLPTVRSHIRSILRKLNVNSQLAAVAIAHGTSREGALGA